MINCKISWQIFPVFSFDVVVVLLDTNVYTLHAFWHVPDASAQHDTAIRTTI